MILFVFLGRDISENCQWLKVISMWTNQIYEVNSADQILDLYILHEVLGLCLSCIVTIPWIGKSPASRVI